MSAPVVIHARVAGRLRLHIDELVDNPALAETLQRELESQRTVTAVTISSVTGNILVRHASSLSHDEVMMMISDALVAARNPAWQVLWWCQTERQTFDLLAATPAGLTNDEWAIRLRRFGSNAQRSLAQVSDWALLGRQFNSLPILLLCASTVLSVVTGGMFDAALVAAVIAANVGIGFGTERRAERVIDSFIRHEKQTALVRRSNQYQEVDAVTLVPGDVLMLMPGTVLPADVRVIASHGLTVDESLLTGESLPVTKTTTVVADPRAALAERCNMAFCGTTVTAGNGIAIVVETGFATEIGRINLAVANTQRSATPMQRQIDGLGRQLTVASLFCSAAVFGLGWLHGIPLFQLIRRSTALAVAAIPEGLPTVATSILAGGMQDMRHHNVLIRSLNAVETLGSVSVICFDKTGTLTRNQMAVTAAMVANRRIVIDGDNFFDGQPIAAAQDVVLIELLRVAALCNESDVSGHDAFVMNGSSTENALLLTAIHAGIDVKALRQEYPLVQTAYRTETQRYMVTVHDLGDRHFTAIKGDPLDVLALCTSCFNDDGIHSLDDTTVSQIRAANADMATRGLRVLGFACAVHGETPIWLGMMGMTDPARPEAAALVRQFQDAGIRTVMLTGDQMGTAMAVAEQVRLAPSIRGFDCAAAIPDTAERIDVYARVSPLHKLTVVRALQEAGHVVAMTGDGTNDGPALRAADIGVTLGLNGTDAARNIADVVLAQDELATMIVAVRQGRTIYANIRKAIHFLVGTNSSEVMLTMVATALAAGQPLNTAQLLWINLVTDVAIGYALGSEPPEADVMTMSPRPRDTPIVTSADYRRLLVKGGVISSSAFVTHLYGMARHGADGGGIAMMTLIGSQLLDGFSSRSQTTPAWNLPANRLLTRCVFGLMGLQALVSVLPFTRQILGIAPLDAIDLGVIGLGSFLPFTAIEMLGKTTSVEYP